MNIKPAPGREVVRYPRTPYQRLPADGATVADNDKYWLRRLRDGDVVLVGDAAAKPAPSAPQRGT
jgi:hypothetical protein